MAKIVNLKGCLTFIFGSIISIGTFADNLADNSKQPNFLLIVLDDLGYSDLGSFGGEIRSPNLDRLAYEGVRFTSFYSAAACSPARAMLLTGVDSHQVGLGNMAEYLTDDQRGKPGYEGHLNDRVETLASRLKNNGYHTYMAGKWHLGAKPGTLPGDRGFERSFALMEGGATHFDQRGATAEHPLADYREDNLPVSVPENFYSSQTYTDKLIGYLNKDRDDGQPFFAYLAYTAPHWPLQAPQKYIERNRGRYDQGYDKLRLQRQIKMQELGIVAQGPIEVDTSLPSATGYRAWDALSDNEKKRQARIMEVYAAMVESVDHQIGRVLEVLEARGELDNTVVVFLSDNGAEGFDKSDWPPFKSWVEKFDNRIEAIGSKDAYPFYGPGWAGAGTAPFSLFKGFSHEGGLRTPAFIWSPNFNRQKGISHELVTVMDITPTLLSLAGVSSEQPHVTGQRGRSMVPFLNRKVDHVYADDQPIGWELMGNAAIRKGAWKLVRAFKPFGSGDWQLFNLERDPSEQKNLAEVYPAKYQELINDWQQYEAENGVILPEPSLKDTLIKFYLFGWEAI